MVKLKEEESFHWSLIQLQWLHLNGNLYNGAVSLKCNNIDWLSCTALFHGECIIILVGATQCCLESSSTSLLLVSRPPCLELQIFF